MTDLSGLVSEAYERRSRWTEGHARAFCETARRDLPGLCVRHDAAAGDEWMRLLSASDTVGVVRIDMPLMLHRAPLRRTARSQEAQACGVVAFEADDFFAADYSLDEAVYRLAFGRQTTPQAIDLRGFCINDLWVVTV